jgi:hypothetical protein
LGRTRLAPRSARGLARGDVVDYTTVLQPAACEKGIIVMSHQVVVSAFLGCCAAALLAGVAPANATVYNVNETIDGGSVIGTITTDGATGTIDPSDFVAWDLVLSGPGSTVTIANTDSGAVVFGQGTDITADAMHVSFDFSASDDGFLVFQDGMGLG